MPLRRAGWAMFTLDTMLGAFGAERLLGDPPKVALPRGMAPRKVENEQAVTDGLH
jgi:hypothetical protein